MALTSKPITEVIDEREKTPPLRLDLGECASTDILARNIACLKRLHGIADSDRVGVADRTIFMVKINLSAAHARSGGSAFALEFTPPSSRVSVFVTDCPDICRQSGKVALREWDAAQRRHRT